MLREIFNSDVLRSYNYQLTQQQPAQAHIRAARREVAEWVKPGDYRVKASGSAQNLPVVPWVAILDRSVTTTARAGLYLVYLFSADLQRVYLSLNQGITAHERLWASQGLKPKAASLAALSSLRKEAEILWTEIGDPRYSRRIDLGSDRSLPRAYEAGNFAAVEYDLNNVPSEDRLEEDLHILLRLYESAVPLRVALAETYPESFRTPSRIHAAPPPRDRVQEFRPKSSEDYVAFVGEQHQVRSRKHEAVVEAFGKYARQQGWNANTRVHPRDLVIESPSGLHVLCEIKIVGSNAEFAVRDALAQLLTYRAFLYKEEHRPQVYLLAVFSSDIGALFATFLDTLGIASVWAAGGSAWEGSNGAVSIGLPVHKTNRLV